MDADRSRHTPGVRSTATAVRSRTSPPQPDLDQAVDVLRLLADPTRLAILTMLEDTELPVGEIADRLARPIPAVSQHLARLRAGRLVTTRRAGTSVYYSQPDEHIAALVTNVLHHTEHVLYERPPHHAPMPDPTRARPEPTRRDTERGPK